MDAVDILGDGFTRVAQSLPRTVQDLSPADLLWRPGEKANPIAWLLWHIGRGTDAQVADLGQRPEVWTEEGWAQRFGLPFPTEASGYGQSAEEVGRFNVNDPDLLLGYCAAAYARAQETLATEDDERLDRVVDTSWNPPVTAGVRWFSILHDATQHLGQAMYVRGLRLNTI